MTAYQFLCGQTWIPICVGMTMQKLPETQKKRNRTNRIPAFTGMTGFWVVVIYRENGNPYAVIPAQAGI
ncbi:hypothetical protein JY81_08230 [Neisseria meningitidis]|nr:hypothetical protein JY81_08230 [Neisseria meningitidis]